MIVLQKLAAEENAGRTKEGFEMVCLVPYSPGYERQILPWISQFFEFHEMLLSEDRQGIQDEESRRTIAEWLTPPNVFFIIMDSAVPAGFIRICYRGPEVAWIEDVFVDKDHRGRGIATDAIKKAERIIMDTPGYTAVCLDVSPRNTDALKLYHKLGYVDLSLVTIRKELKGSKRDRPIHLFDLDFNY